MPPAEANPAPIPLHRDEAIMAAFIPAAQPLYRVEPADRPPRATVLFAHGLGEHAFWAMPTARRWARRGYRVELFHLRGHGPRPGELGVFHGLAADWLRWADEPAWLATRLGRQPPPVRYAAGRAHRHNQATLKRTTVSHHVAQMRDALAWVVADRRQRGDRSPLLLAGHSLGGLVALTAAMEAREPIDGLVLLSPALRAAAPPWAGPAGHAVLELSWAARRRRGLAALEVFLRTLMRLNVTLPATWSAPYISDLPAVRRLHAADPLILRALPSGFLDAIERRMAATFDAAERLPCDLLCIAGERDPIVRTDHAMRFCEALREGRGAQAAEAHVYAHTALHELHRSSYADDLFDRIDEWVGGK